MLKSHYSHFFAARPKRLHFAAHSHHPWPDVTREAQIRYWDDSVKYADQKWSKIFGEVVPTAQRYVGELLGLQSFHQIAFAPNTHEFVSRILSCVSSDSPFRVLTTDGEFHSFTRQIQRFEELPQVVVERVPCHPFGNFEDRFFELAKEEWDLIFLSHVFFNSGFAIENIEQIFSEVISDQTILVLDCYHSFCALPLNLSKLEGRVFLLGGGYKYAQSGEGACFLAVPSGCSLRPQNTGWFATFGNLEKQVEGNRAEYPTDAFRFWGATFDSSGIYRFNAVMRWLSQEFGTLTSAVTQIHSYVQDLQNYFLERLQDSPVEIQPEQLVTELRRWHGHFLAFEDKRASSLYSQLLKQDVVTDYRGDRLRFGFGPYQSKEDIDELFQRWEKAL